MKVIDDFMKKHPLVSDWVNLGIAIVIAAVVVFLLLKLEKRLGKRWVAKHDGINARFSEKILRFLIVFIAIQCVIMTSPLTASFGNSLFQGTAVIAAIAGFAAKPILTDMFCGIMISTTKPFNIGDRIEFENGTGGIVKDITIRHVVLQGIDTLKIVIPNSEINARTITNLSQRPRSRSIHFRFTIGLNSDIEKAKQVIEKAVQESPFTVPRDGDTYSPVYFIAYEQNGLTMAVTAYYEPVSPTERVKDDVNSRVKAALDQAGVEIPYAYLNILTEQDRTKTTDLLS